MRYVSRSPKYSIGVKEGEFTQINGMLVEQSPKRLAKFTQGLALDHEVEAALKAFTFHGLPDGVPPETMISVLDTRDYQKQNDLSDEEREEIERKLEANPSFGTDYIRVEELRAPKPWPSYDDDSVDEIASAIERFQFNPDDVRRYEQENLNRPELIEKLVELGADDVQRSDLETLSAPTHESLELTDNRTGAKKTVVVPA